MQIAIRLVPILLSISFIASIFLWMLESGSLSGFFSSDNHMILSMLIGVLMLPQCFVFQYHSIKNHKRKSKFSYFYTFLIILSIVTIYYLSLRGMEGESIIFIIIVGYFLLTFIGFFLLLNQGKSKVNMVMNIFSFIYLLIVVNVFIL